MSYVFQFFCGPHAAQQLIPATIKAGALAGPKAFICTSCTPSSSPSGVRCVLRRNFPSISSASLAYVDWDLLDRPTAVHSTVPLITLVPPGAPLTHEGPTSYTGLVLLPTSWPHLVNGLHLVLQLLGCMPFRALLLRQAPLACVLSLWGRCSGEKS